MELRFFVLCAAVVGLSQAGKHDLHSGNTVHEIHLRDTSDQELLHEMELQMDLDIWQHGMPGVRSTKVMVTPEHKDAFLDTLDAKGIQHSVYLEDVAKALEDHDEQITTWMNNKKNRMIFQGYPRYAEINAYMENIAEQYPNLVTLVTVGQSYEGRDIKYLKISTSNFSNTTKPIYVMTAMLHAREWVTTPVTLYSIFRLVENRRSEDNDLLSDVDWIIMPLVNPDGYEFSHTDNRLWRKTRSIIPNSDCIGVDPNRNFDVAFATLGVSANPCAENYPGETPFSEPETGYLRDIFHEYIDRIQIYMDIHSFGNYVLFAYGDTSLPPNAPQLLHVSTAMGAAMDALKLPKVGYYLVGNAASVLYVTSGCSQDYGASIGIPFSFTIELPGYEYDFRVPPEYMDQINEETWQGIAVTARLSRAYYTARNTAAST